MRLSIFAHRTFKRGVEPLYAKELTSGSRIAPAALPSVVVIPLLQGAGAVCGPLVKKGDPVAEGQKIGDAQAFISAPVHASISGKVREVEYHQAPFGKKVLSVVIEGDGSVRDWTAAGREAAAADMPREDIIRIVREAGIVGMGGAAFPTYVKITGRKDRLLDSYILNGCECEPFLTADHRLMLEEPGGIIEGFMALMKAAGARSGFIAIEENKPDAVAAMERACARNPVIKVVAVKTKYPQGAEKMLIKVVLGRTVPTGGLPLDVGAAVNNVGTALAVFEALRYGKPLIERALTVSGEAVAEPKNLRVRIGASFEDVINQCGGIRGGFGGVEVLSGGPMMGVAQQTMAVPVVKGTSGITVIAPDKSKSRSYGPCIRCARCVEACPVSLMPYRLGDYGRVNLIPEFKAWGGFSCIECGCCSYICPAKRPLLHWIRVGKFKSKTSSGEYGR